MILDNPIVCEIRCPIHGFIGLTSWERSIVDSSVFQRLRRLRQLAWTDYVYPGAMHSRFEHSLGVMHIATLLFDSIRKNSEEVLKGKYKYNDQGLERERQKIRLAALLHDVGHAPFSHACEDLFPFKPGEEQNAQLLLNEVHKPRSRYKHEDYSYALIRHTLRPLIEDHDTNLNYKLQASEIADLLQGSPSAGKSLLWRDILDHQLDADRMDYLLRDSHHLGVNYGKYDLNRLVASVCAYESVYEDQSSRSVKIGVLNGGLHAAESLVMARYWMFKQVYLHKTRLAFDLHLRGAMKELLAATQCFPLPTPEGLNEYLEWDDWKVQGMLGAGQGGDHAKRLTGRLQFRQVYKSDDRLVHVTDPTKRYAAYLEELASFTKIKESMLHLGVVEVPSSNVYYKSGESKAISVIDESDRTDIRPLEEVSPIKSLNTFDQLFLYSPPENSDEARKLAAGMAKKFRDQGIQQPQVPGASSNPSLADTVEAKKDSASIANIKIVGRAEANGR